MGARAGGHDKCLCICCLKHSGTYVVACWCLPPVSLSTYLYYSSEYNHNWCSHHLQDCTLATHNPLPCLLSLFPSPPLSRYTVLPYCLYSSSLTCFSLWLSVLYSALYSLIRSLFSNPLSILYCALLHVTHLQVLEVIGGMFCYMFKNLQEQ